VLFRHLFCEFLYKESNQFEGSNEKNKGMLTPRPVAAALRTIGVSSFTNCTNNLKEKTFTKKLRRFLLQPLHREPPLTLSVLFERLHQS
jgi:hypothetical protein